MSDSVDLPLINRKNKIIKSGDDKWIYVEDFKFQLLK